MANNTSSPSQEELDAIHKLYVEENLKLEGDGGLMDTMQKRHGFEASKSQYERIFRQLGVKKNLTKGEWRAIIHKIDERKSCGKRSEVFLNDRRLSKGKVNKEKSRYNSSRYNGRHIPDVLPQRVRISTPPGDRRLETQIALPNLPEMIYQQTIEVDFVDITDLPSSQFCTYLDNAAITWSHVSGRSTFLGANSSFAYNASLQEFRNGVFLELKKTFFDVTNNKNGYDMALRMLGKKLVNPAGFDVVRYLKQLSGFAVDAYLEKLLISAVKDENLPLVALLLDRSSGARLNPDSVHIRVKHNVRLTPLLFACLIGNDKLFKILLEVKADPCQLVGCMDCVNQVNGLSLALQYSRVRGFVLELRHQEESVPIIPVLDKKRVAIVTCLLEKGAKLDIYTTSCCHPLFIAVKKGYIDLLKFFLENKAVLDPNNQFLGYFPTNTMAYHITKRATRTSLINCAAYHGRDDIFELLIQYKAEIDDNTFMQACTSGKRTLVDRVIQLQGLDSIREFASGNEIPEAAGHSDPELAVFLLKEKFRCKSSAQLKTAITRAAEAGFRYLVEQLLSTHKDLRRWNSTSFLGVNARIAAHGEEMVKILLDAQAVVLIEALAEIILNKKIELFDLMQQVCFDLDREGNFCVVKAAVCTGDPAILKHVLSYDEININKKSGWPSSFRRQLQKSSKPLSASRKVAYINGLSILTPRTPLEASILLGNTEIIQILLDAGANTGEYDDTSLALAADISDLYALQFLLKAGADPHNEKALSKAVERSNYEIIEELLAAYKRRYGKIRRGFGCSALQSAIVNNAVDMVDMLLQNGVDPNKLVRTIYRSSSIVNALGTALRVQGINYRILRSLVEANANPNGIVSCEYKNDDSSSWDSVTMDNDLEIGNYSIRKSEKMCCCFALTAAVLAGNLAAAKFLISQGADCNPAITARVRETPLQAASFLDNIAMVQLLLDNGAIVNAPPSLYRSGTALQQAAMAGNVFTATLLIKWGANVNAEGAQILGLTALEVAAKYGRVDMLQLLLKAGASIDGDGEDQYNRAIRLAEMHGHRMAKDLLMKWRSRTGYQIEYSFMSELL